MNQPKQPNSTLTLPHKVVPQNRRVCVVGLGYVGLPMAAVLARAGFDVLGIDVRTELVARVNSGKAESLEPGLAELIAQGSRSGRLRASLQPEHADVFIICVPTPLQSNNAPSLEYVEKACRTIRPFVRRHSTIILESTSPPGTTSDIVTKCAVPEDLEVGKDVFVAYCPERVLPGHALAEIVGNDRIVGGVTTGCALRVKSFFESFVEGAVLMTDSITAEITKLVENSFRDVNIAFANEIATLSDRLGTDPFEVIRLANRHPRVNVLSPGPGVGGHCIPVDPWFLVHADSGVTRLIQTARRVNDSQPARVVSKVRQLVHEHSATTIGCLGVTYKADIGDFRGSPGLEVVRLLCNQVDAEILVCDPVVENNDFREFPLSPLSEVLSRSEVLVLLTDHSAFQAIPMGALAGKLVVDPRGKLQSANSIQRRTA